MTNITERRARILSAIPMTEQQKADALTAAIADGWVESQDHAGYWHRKTDTRGYGLTDTNRVAYKYITPVVGMAATVQHVNDCYAARITKVSPNGGYIEVEYGGHEEPERFNRGRADFPSYYVKRSHGSVHVVCGIAESYINPDI